MFSRSFDFRKRPLTSRLERQVNHKVRCKPVYGLPVYASLCGSSRKLMRTTSSIAANDVSTSVGELGHTSGKIQVTTMAQKLDEVTKRKLLEQTEIGSLLLECGCPPNAAYEFMLRIQRPSKALLRELKQLAGTPERVEVGTINICVQPPVIVQAISQIVQRSPEPETVD